MGTPEEKIWHKVKDMLGGTMVGLGPRWGAILSSDPGSLPVALSRYKFAAKMSAKGRVLELGCGEGIGVPILSEFAESYLGVDTDPNDIDFAALNWSRGKVKFLRDDFLGKKYGSFGSVVCMDIEGHARGKEGVFFQTVYENLHEYGIGVMGLHGTAAFGPDMLARQMSLLFHNVFSFAFDDMTLRAGNFPGSGYHMCVGCYKKAAGRGQ